MSENNMIQLYPLNWLYNAGVVGFLSCLDREDYLKKEDNSKNIEKYTIKNEVVNINKEIFERIKIEENYFENGKVVNLKGKNSNYPNFIDAKGKQKDIFIQFVKLFSKNNLESECFICSKGIYINEGMITENISGKKESPKEKFLNKIKELDMVHNKLLGPSDTFPNSYWNLNDKFKICHLCSFILIHHHLAFTTLSDGSEIFINAPSFKVMYELNKLVKELFGSGRGDSKQKREILAMSIVEYTRRIQVTLAQWTSMNIEIVIKHQNSIDFYNLPYETISLISDREIASLLSDIGEFSVLNCILDGKISELLNMAGHLTRISIKKEKNKSDNALINNLIKKEINRNNINKISQKLLKLYAKIKERREKYAGAEG